MSENPDEKPDEKPKPEKAEKPEAKEVDINNPPFVFGNVSPARVHQAMLALAAWTATYRDESNKEIGTPDCIPKFPFVPKLEFHLGMGVNRLNAMIAAIQRIRELWDRSVRMFEDNWLCDAAKRDRHNILHVAADLLATVYLSDEMLEARHAAHCKKAGGSLRKMLDLGHIMVLPLDPETMQAEEEDEDGEDPAE